MFRMGVEDARRLCSLEAAVGEIEACPEGACPFWEVDGGGCAFEQLHVVPDSALAAWLLELRQRLAAAESTAAADEVHRLFSHLLNDASE
jgi:hypothetical protein